MFKDGSRRWVLTLFVHNNVSSKSQPFISAISVLYFPIMPFKSWYSIDWNQKFNIIIKKIQRNQIIEIHPKNF